MKVSVRTILLSICTSLAFTLNMAVPELKDTQKGSRLLEVIWNLKRSIEGQYFVPILIMAVLLMVTGKIAAKDRVRSWWIHLLNLFFASAWLMGNGFMLSERLRILYCTWGQRVKSVIYLIGIWYFLTILMDLLYMLLHTRFEIKKADGLFRWLEEKPFQRHFIVLAILWLPHLIVAYPANFCWDSFKQLKQYFGTSGWSSHHPPVSSWIMGTLIKLGSGISTEAGFFLFVVVQAFVFALVVAYSFALLMRLRAPRWMRALWLGVAVVVPYYPAYFVLFLKDNLYSYLAVLLVIELTYLVLLRQAYFKSVRHIILFGISVLGVMLLRNNGRYIIYIMCATGACLMLAALLKKQKPLLKSYLKCAVMLVVPIVLSMGISSVMTSHYNIEPGCIREAFSIPMQQTARYVKYYKKQITQEERDGIERVLPVDKLAKKYDPYISDPVKSQFKERPTTEDLIVYFKTWFKMLWKHPIVYIEATAEQNYCLFYPGKENFTLYDYVSVRENVNKLFELEEHKPLAYLKDLSAAWYKLCGSLPVFNLFCHPASYTLVLLWLCCFYLKEKKYTGLLITMPMYLTALIIIASPVIQGHARYAFPIIYALHIPLCYYMYDNRCKKEV